MATASPSQYKLFQPATTGAAPRLLVEWEPFWPSFLTNLLDTLLRREPPPVAVTAKPAAFWPDVFVNRPMPWKNFGQSAGLHALLFLAIYLTGHLFWVSRQPTLTDPYTHTAITYYAVDELLPSLKSLAPKAVAKVSRKAEPEFAPQEIISVPVGADNSTQTIVNPMHPNVMRQEAELPNMMVWETVPAPPVAALKSRITLPTMTVTPVAPAPDTSHLKQSRPVLDQSATAVEPAPVVRDVRNKPSDLSLATKVDAVAPAPKLELPLQRAALNEKGQDVVAPPPATQNLPAGPNPSGQLLALSVRPKAPSGELRVPDGSRSGVFAATPTGKPGAPGTPELVTNDSGVETGGSGKADTKQGSGSGNSSGLAVPGISVTGGDTRHGTSAVVAKVPQTQPEAPRTIASAAKPLANSPFASPSAIDRQPVAPYTPPSERKVEDEVFGKRKYYSMQLNMPNLTSAGGSWIIRFAELRETPESSTSELSTPVVTTKVDPAYPPDLMQERVEGFVTLYAVINANGSVGEVRLLRGLNDRLDENAIKALGRWHFRPATRNGVAVALEAVVQIPFKARRFSSF